MSFDPTQLGDTAVDDDRRRYGPWKRIFIVSRVINKKRVWFQWYFVRRVSIEIENMIGYNYDILQYAKTEFDILRAK